MPLVDIGEDRVDPLRDGRVEKVLEKVGTENSCVRPLSFGQEGQEENRLRRPESIATNSDGQFIVADDRDKTIKVFDSNGNFLRSFNTRINDVGKDVTISPVATDENNSIYVLQSFKKPGAEDSEREVKVFNSTAEQLLKFPAGSNTWYFSARMAVTKNKVLVLRKTGNTSVVDAYDHEGAFVGQFDENIIRRADHITADDDGRKMIMSTIQSCIYVFTDDGEQLSKFHIDTEEYLSHDHRIGCQPEGEHVVVGGGDFSTGLCSVFIYTKDGNFVRKITLHGYLTYYFNGITVTRKGQIAVAVSDCHGNGKVIICD